MRELGWLVRKDLALFFADRQGALMTVLVPVVLASLLGMLFAPRSSSSVVKILVAAEETAPPVRDFVKAIADCDSLEVEEVSAATARDRVARGDASLALLLPAGTARSLRPETMFQRERGHAELLYDPSHEIEVNIASGLLTQLLMERTMSSLSSFDSVRTMFDSLAANLPADANPSLRTFIDAGRQLEPARPKSGGGSGGGVSMQPPLAFDKVAATVAGPGQGYNSYAHNFAGMLLMFLLFAAQARAKHLVNERDSGTLARLRLSPAGDAVILAATGVSTTIIALLASAVVYAVGIAVFRVEIQGPLLGFVGVVLAQAVFVGGFALLLAGLGRTEEQIGSIGSFAILVMSFAGGAMVPSFLMPGWLHSASLVLPTYWATKGLAAMTWRGLGLHAAGLPIAILLAAGIVCALVGMRRFRFRT